MRGKLGFKMGFIPLIVRSLWPARSTSLYFAVHLLIKANLKNTLQKSEMFLCSPQQGYTASDTSNKQQEATNMEPQDKCKCKVQQQRFCLWKKLYSGLFCFWLMLSPMALPNQLLLVNGGEGGPLIISNFKLTYIHYNHVAPHHTTCRY